MQVILQHLFKKNTLQDVPLETLQELVRQYPFFAPGHYFLAKKLQASGERAYDEHLRKTALYFHNPLWLHHLLTSTKTEPPDTSETVETETEDQSSRHETEVPDAIGDTYNNMPDHQQAVAGQPTLEAMSSSHDLIEEVVLHQETFHPIPEKPDNEEEVAAENTAVAEFEPAQFQEEEEPLAEEEELDEEEEVIPFQAYHTIDYFASQGIRLSPDIQPDDKLGKQLKSFTEWLKTMRKLPQATEQQVPEQVISDPQIEQFAAHSLEENEVVTEAMAEVLVKQGKNDKAREVYHKLSLINPHKSAYFASKIEDLKQR